MKNLRYLNKYFFKYKWHLLLGIVFIAATNLFKVYAPVIVKEGINYVGGTLEAKDSLELAYPELPEAIVMLNEQGLTDFEKIEKPIDPTDVNSFVLKVSIALGLLFGLMYVIQGIFLFLTRVSIIIMSRRIEYDLKNEIFSHYQKLSLSFFKRNNTGDLMNRISEDVSKVRMYLGPAVMYTINLFFLIVFILWAMFSVSAKLTLYTLLPLPILSISIYYVSTIINRKSEKVQKKQSELSSFVQESTSGIRVLKAYNRERSFAEHFENESSSYKKLSLSLVKVEALFMPLIVLLVGLSTVLVIYLGGLEALKGTGFTESDIFMFVIYVNMLTWPFASVGWVTSLVNKAEASQKRINEFLNTDPEIVSEKNLCTEIAGNIEFKGVSFTYPDTGINALQNVSFKIEKGKTLGITGKTGSGKSSLINLISRQYDIDKGEILINGHSITNLNLEKLRSAIGSVPQDVFLFSDTIENNIAFGVDEYSQADLVQATKDANVYDNIIGFPDKFDTILGERGINLSGGQKQRVSIARAIIKNPDILIFDDCLSAVDTETEEKILHSLKSIMKNKTSIIISHRISSIMHADEIIVLENGAISQSGNHAELMKQKGYYSELYHKQLVED